MGMGSGAAMIEQLVGRVRESRTCLAWLTSVGETHGFSTHILDVYDESRSQGGLRFGEHRRMM